MLSNDFASFSKVLTLFASAVVFTFLPTQISAQGHDEKWISIRNSSLEPSEGSALDLSSLSIRRVLANKVSPNVVVRGERFQLDGTNQENVKFFTATLNFAPNDNGYPDHATSDRLAVMIKRNGYNAVRVHMVEAMLMTGRKKSFDFDPEQLDRFFYLINALRNQGMYFFVDMLGSWNGAYGDVNGHRWTRGQYDVTLGSLMPGEARDHWLSMVKALWAQKNPYSGLATLADPAVAGVVLVNEGGPDFLLRNAQRAELISPFREWLVKTYGSSVAIQKQVGKLPEEISPPPVTEKTPLGQAFQRFTAGLQAEQFAWMKAQLQRLGFNGPVTSFNDWPGYHSSAGRIANSFVDMHQYADHPMNGMVERNTKITNGSVLDGRNRYLDRLAWTRHFGQPYTVTEYGQPFWNPTRWESAPFTAAYAALQGWSLIANYGNTFSLTRPALGKWRAMMVPFEVGTDPTLRAGETIAAFLFARGDVAPSQARLAVAVDPAEASSMPADKFVSWQLAQMQYVLAVGLQFGGTKSATTLDIKNALTVAAKNDDQSATQIYKRLLETKTVAADTWTNPSTGRYLSSTGELQIDLKQNFMRVMTQGSVGVLGNAGASVDASKVAIKIEKGNGAAFVCDLTSANLSTSQRALMVVSTDSRNTGMTFLDANEQVLDQIGTFPARIKDISISVAMPALSGSRNWKLFALNFNGLRTQEIPVDRQADGKASAQLTLSTLGDKATPYFEWIAE